MPAKRLPWFKMWPEAMRHEKIALLSDALFRTWVKALADGSEQAIRWRFANVQHAASVTGRPAKHIRELIAARLLDESANGEVWVHDWRQWQDRYESDFAPKPTAEDSAKTPRRLRERSDLSTRETEERGERRDTERELEPEPNVPGALVVAGGAGGAAIAAGGADAPPTATTEPEKTKRKKRVPDEFPLTDKHYDYGESLGLDSEGVERQTEKFLAHHRFKGTLGSDWYAGWQNWMRDAVGRFADQPRSPRNGSSRPPPNGQTALESRDASKYFETRGGTLPRR